MKRIVLSALLIILVFSRTYPLFKQCDSKWGTQPYGTSHKTICSAGGVLCCIAMGLAGIGKNFNPSTLNQWLKSHGGYISDDIMVWGSVSPLGLHFLYKVQNEKIKSNIDVNNVVIMNINSGGHWVLATGYSGNIIYVNDPGTSRAFYDISQIEDGQNIIYTIDNKANSERKQ